MRKINKVPGQSQERRPRLETSGTKARKKKQPEPPEADDEFIPRELVEAFSRLVLAIDEATARDGSVANYRISQPPDSRNWRPEENGNWKDL